MALDLLARNYLLNNYLLTWFLVVHPNRFLCCFRLPNQYKRKLCSEYHAIFVGGNTRDCPTYYDKKNMRLGNFVLATAYKRYIRCITFVVGAMYLQQVIL